MSEGSHCLRRASFASGQHADEEMGDGAHFFRRKKREKMLKSKLCHIHHSSSFFIGSCPFSSTLVPVLLLAQGIRPSTARRLCAL